MAQASKKTAPEGTCRFAYGTIINVYEANYRCRTMPDGDQLCPRHRFLIEQFGEESAIKVELGWPCDICQARFDSADHLHQCGKCGAPHVCDDCRLNSYCHEE